MVAWHEVCSKLVHQTVVHKLNLNIVIRRQENRIVSVTTVAKKDMKLISAQQKRQTQIWEGVRCLTKEALRYDCVQNHYFYSYEMKKPSNFLMVYRRIYTVRLSKTMVQQKYSEVIKDYGTTKIQWGYQRLWYNKYTVRLSKTMVQQIYSEVIKDYGTTNIQWGYQRLWYNVLDLLDD